jgi:molybdate transport system regulatory protein
MDAVSMPLPPLLTQHLSRRPQRIELLRHVAEQGSITGAAKSAGVSYKAAWDAVDELNNLAQKPLVVRAVGGRGGGGAILSEEGQRVLRLYRRLQALQAQVLATGEGEHNDLALLNRLMLRTSARNQLLGRIVSITRSGHNDLICLQLAGELHLSAAITHESTLSLALEVGADVVALIKAGSLQVLPCDHPRTDGQNTLPGVIDEVIDAEDGPSEVRIGLSAGQTLCALASACQLAGQALTSGCHVQVQFPPSLVLLGTLL